MQNKEKKTIEVILSKNTNLNKEKLATIQKVKPGYFRNYIIPLKLGKKATPTLIQDLKLREKELTVKELQFREKYILNKELLESLGKFEISLKVGESGKIFGKVTQQQILELLKENVNLTVKLEKNQLQLPKIKQIGLYKIEIFFTKDIIAKIDIEILPK